MHVSENFIKIVLMHAAEGFMLMTIGLIEEELLLV